MIASLITPFLSLPCLVADTAGPELLLSAFASTVSITTSMSLVGVFRVAAVQELSVCRILQHSDLVLIRSSTKFHNI